MPLTMHSYARGNRGTPGEGTEDRDDVVRQDGFAPAYLAQVHKTPFTRLSTTFTDSM
jgi:hypothetical protein